VDTKLPMDYGSDEESILPDDNLGYETNSMTEPQLCDSKPFVVDANQFLF